MTSKLRARTYGYIDSNRNVCSCYHCNKEIRIYPFYSFREKWKVAASLTEKSWRYVKRFRRWFCPACKLLPQYHQTTARILMKSLLGK